MKADSSITRLTEHSGQVVNTSALYSGSFRFRSQSRDQICWL